MKLLNLIESLDNDFDNECEKAKLRAQTLFKAFKKGTLTFPFDMPKLHYEFIGEAKFKCREHHKDPNSFILLIIIHTYHNLPFPFVVYVNDEKMNIDSYTETTKKSVFDRICHDISKKLRNFNIILTAHMS